MNLFLRQAAYRSGSLRQQFSLAFAVCAAASRPVLWDDIFALLWGEREDGGPEWWRTHVSVLRVNANRALAPLGVRLSGGRGTGRYVGGLMAVDLAAGGAGLPVRAVAVAGARP